MPTDNNPRPQSTVTNQKWTREYFPLTPRFKYFGKYLNKQECPQEKMMVEDLLQNS